MSRMVAHNSGGATAERGAVARYLRAGPLSPGRALFRPAGGTLGKADGCYPLDMPSDRQTSRRRICARPSSLRRALPARCERRRCGTPAATVGLSRRESLVGLLFTVVAGAVSIATNITTWFIPPLPQRQALEQSGGTHHLVDAGNIELVVTLSQPQVTVVPATQPVTWRV